MWVSSNSLIFFLFFVHLPRYPMPSRHPTPSREPLVPPMPEVHPTQQQKNKKAQSNILFFHHFFFPFVAQAAPTTHELLIRLKLERCLTVWTWMRCQRDWWTIGDDGHASWAVTSQYGCLGEGEKKFICSTMCYGGGFRSFLCSVLCHNNILCLRASSDQM